MYQFKENGGYWKKLNVMIIVIVLVFILAVFLHVKPKTNSDATDVRNTEDNPYSNALANLDIDIEDLDDVQLIEELFEHYSLIEIINMEYSDYGSF